eukprot:TRINITY_DN24659_c0_g5_i3.p1 TRINITY_DN24659_c0_g5~~TRINITY_DN24659_c0_g5_i3.p1  ORF type:complete len:2977 (+),score=464.59 TRINITY_DN24659_c0_g5_i3:158-9088(+)
MWRLDGVGIPRPSQFLAESHLDFWHELQAPVLRPDASHPVHSSGEKPPPHGIWGGQPQEMVLLEFSEAVQMGQGVFELWSADSIAAENDTLAYSVDVETLRTRSRSTMLSGKRLLLAPQTFCSAAPRGDLQRGVSYYLKTSPPGVVSDLFGNKLPRLNTRDTWRFTVATTTADVVPPSVLTLGGTYAKPGVTVNPIWGRTGAGFATMYVYFTQRVVAAGSGALVLTDCGKDFDCATTYDNPPDIRGGPDAPNSTVSLEYGSGALSLEGGDEYGALRISWRPPYHNRRYKLHIPANFVKTATTIDSSKSAVGPLLPYEAELTIGSVPQDAVTMWDLNAYSAPAWGSCSAVSTGYLASHCDYGRLSRYAPPWTQATESYAFVGNAESFLLLVDTRSLDVGRKYRICTDLDGPGAALDVGDSGQIVYTTPLRAVHPDFVRPRVGHTDAPETQVNFRVTRVADGSERVEFIAGGVTEQWGERRFTAVTFRCAEQACTSGRTAVRAAPSCDDLEYSGSEPGWSGLVQKLPSFDGEDVSTTFLSFVDATMLEAGTSYRLCVDVDGQGELPVGDSGLLLDASPFAALSPTITEPSASLVLSITCDPNAGCTQHTALYLSLGDCDRTLRIGLAGGRGALRTAAVPLTPLGDVHFEAKVDARHLRRGEHYRVCVDVDGATSERLGFARAGVIYMRGITAIGALKAETAAVSIVGPTTLDLHCAEGCEEGRSAVAVMKTCGGGFKDANEVQTSAQGLRTAAVTLQGSAPDFRAVVDATELTPGEVYRLCADLDGFNGTMTLGDTGIGLFVSPLSECKRCVVQASPAQRILMGCSNCLLGGEKRDFELPEEVEEVVDVNNSNSSFDQSLAASGDACNQNGSNETDGNSSGCAASNKSEAATEKEDHRIIKKTILETYRRVCDYRAVNVNSSSNVTRPNESNYDFVYKCSIVVDLSEVMIDWTRISTLPVSSAPLFAKMFLASSTCEAGPRVTTSGPGVEKSDTVFDRSPMAALKPSLPSAWMADVDATNLRVGVEYVVCLDMRGFSDGVLFGDSGLRVYATPVTEASLAAIPRGRFDLQLTCAAGTEGCGLGFGTVWGAKVWLSDAEAPCPTSGPLRAQAKTLTVNPGIPTGASVTMDASSFAFGRTAKLCTDWGGRSLNSDTGVRLHVSAVVALSSYAIDASPGHRLVVACANGAKCSDRLILYFAERCASDEPRRSRDFKLERPAGDRVAPEAPDALWRVTLDGSGLSQGVSLRLCEDIDGPASDFAPGDTGLRIYIRGVSTRKPLSLVALPQQTLELECSSGCGLSDRAPKAFVAPDCSAAAADAAAAAAPSLQPQSLARPHSYDSSSRTVVLDGTGLEVGRTHRLCVALATSAVPTNLLTPYPPFNDTGLDVYVSPFSSISPRKILPKKGASVRRFVLLCAPSCPSQTTTVRLISAAARCGGSPARAAAADAAPYATARRISAAHALMVDLDVSKLVMGRHYRACVTVGSFKEGDAGLQLFASPVASVATPAVRPGFQQQKLCLVCPGCSQHSLLRATSLPSCAEAGRPFDASAPEGTRFAAMVQHARAPWWCATIDTRHLRAGGSYRICLDADGLDLRVGPGADIHGALGNESNGSYDDYWVGSNGTTVQSSYVGDMIADEVGRVFALPDEMLEGGISPTAIEYGTGVLRFKIGCSRRTCSGASLVHLATECDTTLVTPGTRGLSTAPARLEMKPGTVLWDAKFDVSVLAPGVRYQLCLDADGVDPNFDSGDTGLIVHTRAFVSVDPPRLAPPVGGGMAAAAHLQRFRVHCPVCSKDAFAYLAARNDCVRWEPDSDASPEVPLVPVLDALQLSKIPDSTARARAAEDYDIELDTRKIRLGLIYALCVDVDGPSGDLEPGPGTTLYVSPASGRYTDEPARPEPGQRLVLQCGSCRVATTLFVASRECELGPAPTRSWHEGSIATNLKPLASGAGVPLWYADLALEGLVEGAEYRICMDLDGSSMIAPPGFIGERLYITPVTGLASEIALQHASNQEIHLQCSKCTPAVSTLRIAVSCGNPSSSDGPNSSKQEPLVQHRDGAWKRSILDLSRLKPGMQYALCLDLDGQGSSFPEGKIGNVVISPVSKMIPSVIRKHTAQKVLLHCQTCSQASVAYIAASCQGDGSTTIPKNLLPIFAPSGFGALGNPSLSDLNASIPSGLLGNSAGNSGYVGGWFEFVADTSKFDAGKEYTLCVDIAGRKGGRVGLDTGQRMHITAAYELATNRINATAEQTISIRCDPGACKKGIALLAQECDKSDTGGITPAKPPVRTRAMPLTASRSFSKVAEGEWYETRVDASSLIVGSRYKVCIDYDGTWREQGLSETGLEVLIMPLACGGFGRNLQAAPAQVFDIACMTSSLESCARATAYLGLECEHIDPGDVLRGGGARRTGASQLLPGVEPQPKTNARAGATLSFPKTGLGQIAPAASAARFVFDTSSLQQGATYKLCVDADGSSGPGRYEDSGCWAHIGGFLSVEPATVLANRPKQRFRIRCAESSAAASPGLAGAAGSAACRAGAYVAICSSGPTAGADAEELRRTGAEPITRLGSTWQGRDSAWEVTLSTMGLLEGTYYQLCVDADGLGKAHTYVSTGILVFAVPEITVEPQVVQPLSGTVLEVKCLRGCSANMPVFLAESCVPHLLEGYAPGVENTGTRTQSQPLIAAPLATTTPGGGFREKGAGGQWTVTLDARPLRPGVRVHVCFGFAGSATGDRVGDSGATVYVAGVTGASPPAVAYGKDVRLGLVCAHGCVPMLLEVFLKTECVPVEAHVGDLGLSARQVGRGAALVGFGAHPELGAPTGKIVGTPPNFEVHLDTRSLPLGQDYRVCVDHDGSQGPLPPVDSGFGVHVTTLSLPEGLTSPLALTRSRQQMVHFKCSAGCGLGTRVALALASHPAGCKSMIGEPWTPIQPDNYLARGGALGGYGAEAWRATLDTSKLLPGTYRFCADLDGQVGNAHLPGDSGILVEVS